MGRIQKRRFCLSPCNIDRNDYVSAGELKIGEQVKTRNGLTTLKDKKKLTGTHPVYNLEIYRDHNYMVSMDSILVHNDSPSRTKFTEINGDDMLRGIGNGSESANKILRGGNGQAIAGHGEYGFKTGALTTVPEGTTVIAIKHGKSLSDSAGRFLESTNLDKLSRLKPQQRLVLAKKWAKRNGIKDPRMLKRFKDDIVDLEVYTSDQSIPNYIISAPDKLKIYQKSTTVSQPTPLDKLIKPNQGCVGLATCTTIDYTK